MELGQDIVNKLNKLKDQIKPANTMVNICILGIVQKAHLKELRRIRVQHSFTGCKKAFCQLKVARLISDNVRKKSETKGKFFDLTIVPSSFSLIQWKYCSFICSWLESLF